jgi:hypothetical protein
LPTEIIENYIVHTCGVCQQKRSVMRKDISVFAQPRIICSECRTVWQDFGYSSAGHLVFTRAECKRLEAGDEIQRRSPIRYRSLHDAEGIPTTRAPDEDFF